MMKQTFRTTAEQLGSVCSFIARPWNRSRAQQHMPNVPARRADGAAQSPRSEEQLALGRLEAILFLAREPLNSRKLSQYANLADGTQARTLVRRLNEQYDGAGRAFRVERIAGGYQLLTRRTFAPWLRRLAHVPPETRLSPPALETLAVIAYRQPVGRADIEAIRGVNCGEILRQLMDRDFVRIAGRSQELGRPYLYATTKRFLELFGLNHLDDLPRCQELRAAAVPAAAAAANPFAEMASAKIYEPPIDEIVGESTLG
jgi:segregation and condensation protein B